MQDTKNQKNYVIASMSYGDMSVYAATLKMANIILSWHIDGAEPEVLAYAKMEKLPVFLTKEKVLNTLNALLNSQDEKFPISKSKEIDTKQAQKELVLYCFNNNITIVGSDRKAIQSWEFFKQFKPGEFPLLQEMFNSDAVLVDEYIQELSTQLWRISHDKYKETATELAKIRDILEFVEGIVDRSDTSYTLVPIQEE